MRTGGSQPRRPTMPFPHPALVPFIDAVRRAVTTAGADPAEAVQRVADLLRVSLPPAQVVSESNPSAPPRGQRLYVDPDASFSIVGLRWQPGQSTRIHDHISWGAVGVIAGIERETMFDDDLDRIEHTDYQPGETTWFTPPGDIHQVRNVATTTSISIHVYGADLRRADSSVRRYYDPTRLETNGRAIAKDHLPDAARDGNRSEEERQ